MLILFPLYTDKHGMRALRILIMLLLISAGAFYLSAEAQDPWSRKAILETAERMGRLQSVENSVPGWPPQVGKKFPDIKLFDYQGHDFSIKSLKGRPTLVEMVAMSCAGCQAFSGGNRYGGFGGFPSQPDLADLEHYVRTYADGIDLFGPKLSFVQIVVYDLHLEAPRKEHLSAWRSHFNLTRPNTFVISGGPSLANKETFRMIPGFLLLDAEQTVQFDATGHKPKHNFYTQLLPALGRYVR